jgi:hypothetical protein
MNTTNDMELLRLRLFTVLDLAASLERVTSLGEVTLIAQEVDTIVSTIVEDVFWVCMCLRYFGKKLNLIFLQTYTEDIN